ncbi:hypothetical protein ARMSODRAFT_1028279 [Armillaria solidipes]|uniref:Uncharacterized protein n=1 Tax=Armillaria solidipes TaxID=1076256 RepID=A0A2H3AKZ0_9AGAR|nr:hypothetical protein ARMSODRAFT_1028279 [Armillaria solidipes]
MTWLVVGKKRASTSGFFNYTYTKNILIPRVAILVLERRSPCYGNVGWLAIVTTIVYEDKTRALEKSPNEGKVTAASYLPSSGRGAKTYTSGIWTPTELCTRRSGEGVVETFEAAFGQSVLDVLLATCPSFAYEFLYQRSPLLAGFRQGESKANVCRREAWCTLPRLVNASSHKAYLEILKHVDGQVHDA